ncbi:MAG: tetratricopeptide repeat protein [Verrucomicrobiota bacterium]
MIGIVQEQHADRAGLFMQWKRMDWPILVDSLNLLNVQAVPITLAIDEHGIIRKVGIPGKDAAAFAREFVEQKYEPASGTAQKKARLPNFEMLREQTSGNTPEAWLDLADALTLWTDRLDEAIQAYHKAIELSPKDPRAHFRLGVAYRKRFDSVARQAADFQSAVDEWTRALDLNPNQYIWRRRIQQYGPRLDKPYSFYDWVLTARTEIRARGETPIALTVEPSGAEFAHPVKNFEASGNEWQEPDPQNRVTRDNGEFIQIEVTTVPPVIKAGKSARMHVSLRPNEKTKAHWNNEAGGLKVWLNPPPGWSIERRSLGLKNPPQETSREVRHIEFEIQSPLDVKPGQIRVPGYAVYYVCEDVNGACLYRRQDLLLPVTVEPAP